MNFPDDTHVKDQLAKLGDSLVEKRTAIVVLQLANLTAKNTSLEVKQELADSIIHRFVMDIEAGRGRPALRGVFSTLIATISADDRRAFHEHCSDTCREIAESPEIAKKMTPLVYLINALGRQIGGKPLRFQFNPPIKPTPKGGPGSKPKTGSHLKLVKG